MLSSDFFFCCIGEIRNGIDNLDVLKVQHLRRNNVLQDQYPRRGLYAQHPSYRLY
jgi:hypothetical protein